MRPQDAEKRIKELAAELDVGAFLAKMREFEKGGLPGQSMSDGRGGDSPCPVAVTPERDDWLPNRGMPKGRVLGVSDPTDRQIRTDRLKVEQGLRHAALALIDVAQTITAWTVPRTDDTEKAEKLKDERPGGPCPNVYCSNWITGLQDDRGRRVKGQGPALCDRCYRYELRTGRAWTPQQEQAEAS